MPQSSCDDPGDEEARVKLGFPICFASSDSENVILHQYDPIAISVIITMGWIVHRVLMDKGTWLTWCIGRRFWADCGFHLTLFLLQLGLRDSGSSPTRGALPVDKTLTIKSVRTFN